MSNLEKIGVPISIIVVLYFLIFKIETMDAIDTILIISIILLLPYYCYVKWQEYTMAVYKSVFPEDEGDEKNKSLKEEQEESVHPLIEWFVGFGERTQFVASTFVYVVVVFLSAAFFWGSGSSEPSLLYGVIGAAIGFVLAYILIWIIGLFLDFVLWIIFGK